MQITNKNFDNGNPFDFGRTSADYAKYRDVYPPEFYNRLAELKIGVGGQKILDLGTGTGVLPRNMYRFGGQWIGTDISENQIQYAKELSRKTGMEIEYQVSASEALDFPAESFDVVTACQCFMYFDKKIIVSKIHKWLKTKYIEIMIFTKQPYLLCQGNRQNTAAGESVFHERITRNIATATLQPCHKRL